MHFFNERPRKDRDTNMWVCVSSSTRMQHVLVFVGCFAGGGQHTSEAQEETQAWTIPLCRDTQENARRVVQKPLIIVALRL